jgi:hypothetical protein
MSVYHILSFLFRFKNMRNSGPALWRSNRPGPCLPQHQLHAPEEVDGALPEACAAAGGGRTAAADHHQPPTGRHLAFRPPAGTTGRAGNKKPTQKTPKTHLKNPLKMFVFCFLGFFKIFNFL